MAIRNRVGRVMFVASAAALAIGLGATSALAQRATTWTIKPGGAYTAKSGKTILTDTKTGAVLTCTSSTAAGTLKSGSKKTNPVGTVTKSTFSKCTGPAGLTFTVKASATTSKPWKLNATSYSSGTTKGNISGIHAVLTGTNSACKATVDGTGASKDNGKVAVQHKNSAANKLVVEKSGATLKTFNVSNCLGAINSGDSVTFTATFTLNKNQKITSP
jgi:hypothetical protein